MGNILRRRIVGSGYDWKQDRRRKYPLGAQSGFPEAGIPYAAIAMSTDYDCWKDDEVPVTWEEILEIFGKNVNNVIKLLIRTIDKIK